MISVAKSKFIWRMALSIICVIIISIVIDLIVSRPSTVIGSVTDSNGSLIVGLRLILKDANRANHQAFTDKNGRFEFDYIPEGKFVILNDNEKLLSGQVPKGWERIFSNITNVGIVTFEKNPRIIEFAGYKWNVKSGCGRGPGPNCWSKSEQSVWVYDGQLHLKIMDSGGQWQSAEVASVNCTKYGIHRFLTIGRLDNLDINVIAALFLYKDDQAEMDIEFGRWGEVNTISNAQFAIQPSEILGNRLPFSITQKKNITTHFIDWNPTSIQFRSFNGIYPSSSSNASLIREWLYEGNDIPRQEECLRIHISLWLYQGNPPTNGQQAEIIVKEIQLPGNLDLQIE